MIIRFPKRSSPTPLLDRYRLVIGLTLAAAIVSYFWIDLPLAKHFVSISRGFQILAELLTDAIDPKVQVYIWPILYFLGRFLFKSEKLGNGCLLILVSISLANALTEFLKKLLGRARPELFFSEGIYGFTFGHLSNLYSSFPSGHSCTIGAICGAFACLYPRLSYPLLALSFLLAMTRVVLKMHYLSDVIVGVMLGYLVAQWAYKIMKKEYRF